MTPTENQHIDGTQLADGDTGESSVPFVGFESELNLALENKQLEIHLQPIISLGKWGLFGVELLLRWKHPHHGLIMPEYIIPGLEKAGLLHETGQWVLDEASRMNQLWQGNDQQPLYIFMNVSLSQFKHAQFIDSLQTAIANNSLLGEQLVLELSEDCFTEEPAVSQDKVKQLKESGIRLALNYSGTALPLSSDFDNLPVNIIKLNKILIHQISHHQDKRAIMATISSFAHEHGLEVIAEGVETAEQLLFVNALCCTAAQGFLLGHPLDLAAFETHYHSGNNFEHVIEKCSLSLEKNKSL